MKTFYSTPHTDVLTFQADNLMQLRGDSMGMVEPGNKLIRRMNKR